MSRSIDDVSATEERVDAFSTHLAPDDLLQILQRGAAIRGAIEQLSPLRQRLLALAFFHDLSHQEIAATTDLALGTVKSHIRRALATLRKELETTETPSPGMKDNGFQESPNSVLSLRVRRHNAGPMPS
jgi:RNA polymerase sigma factor (sigma-70 family)